MGVFHLNNLVIQGGIYFYLNGGGNTNRSAFVSKIQEYFMDIDRSEISGKVSLKPRKKDVVDY